METSSSSSSVTFIGANIAFGRFVAESLVIGSGLTLIIADVDRETLIAPGLAPFVEYLSSPGATGLFLEGSLLYQSFAQQRRSTSFIGGGLDVGLDSFVKDTWSLRFGPSYRMLLSTDDGAKPIHVIGFNWALSAYF
jgi:hypothetical protein